MPQYHRRQFLSTLATLPLLLYAHSGLAMRDSKAKRLAGTIHEIKGDVFINNLIASSTSSIQAGDQISVAFGGSLIFSMGEDSYLVQEGSSLELISNNNLAISSLRLLTGGLLSVFGKRETSTTIYTRTAAIGIRGTGVYLNSTPEKLYFCTCYGKTDLHLGQHHTEHIEATHHHAFEISGTKEKTMTMAATQVIGHTDDELRLLERYSGRQPLFDL